MAQKTTILALPAVALGAVAGKRFVDFDGSQADTAGAKVMGVAQYDAADGEAYAVDVIGTTIVEAGAAIPLLAKGLTPVKTDAAGKAIPHAGAGTIAAYALQAAGAAGVDVELLLVV